MAALTALALVAAPAGAHANLVRAVPNPGSAVDPPDRARIQADRGQNRA